VVPLLDDVFLALCELLLFAGIPSRDGAKVADDAGIDFNASFASGDGADVNEFLAAFLAEAGIGHQGCLVMCAPRVRWRSLNSC